MCACNDAHPGFALFARVSPYGRKSSRQRAATRATEELHGACPNVRVSIGDVDINQHFFVQEASSHPVILGEPYIMAARMETKVLENGSAYARVKSHDDRHFVQFLTVRKKHERNRGTLENDDQPGF